MPHPLIDKLQYSSEQLSAPNFLGNPSVVESILRRFVDEIRQWVEQRGLGTMTAAEMKEKIFETSRPFAAIFSGEDRNYMPVEGWNTGLPPIHMTHPSLKRRPFQRPRG